jgi:putative spermidine/putrescine transport system substrate-binding protein
MKSWAGRWGLAAGVLASLAVVASYGSTYASNRPLARHAQNWLNSVGPVPMSVLVKGAKAEGEVVGFGMPANWANYGAIWSGFSKTYGVATNYITGGNLSSGEELQAFAAEKKHPVGDVGDIGLSFGPVGVKMGVLAPYKNAYWSQIPANLKDPHGYWEAAYYGAMAFVINTKRVKVIPHTWKDLLKPIYKGMIGFDDPRNSAEAFDAVVAAAYANGGSINNILPGIKFFAALRKSGNWAGQPGAQPAELQSGNCAIAIAWNYIGSSDQQQFKGNPPITVVVPSDSTVIGPYLEVINKYAPHPYAARLLNTYLFSDQGQIDYAESGAYPVRLPYLKLPSSVHLPPLNLNPPKVHLLTGNEAAAQATIMKDWGPMVASQ